MEAEAVTKPITLEEIQAALAERLKMVSAYAVDEVNRLRMLTGHEPSRRWVSDVIADLVQREFNQLDMHQVDAEIRGRGSDLADQSTVAGINAEHDHVWVRKTNPTDDDRASDGRLIPNKAIVIIDGVKRYVRPILGE